jgi:hypothetical protein
MFRSFLIHQHRHNKPKLLRYYVKYFELIGKTLDLRWCRLMKSIILIPSQQNWSVSNKPIFIGRPSIIKLKPKQMQQIQNVPSHPLPV